MIARCQTYGLPISGCHSMHERELKVLHDREEPELLSDFSTSLFYAIFETEVFRMVRVFYAE